MFAYYYGRFDYWQNKFKISWDINKRLITINSDVDVINVRIDLYSATKRWMLIDKLYQNYRTPFRAVGGDFKSDGSQLGTTYFLTNNWQILLDHGVTFEGNLDTDDFTSPYLVAKGVELAINDISTLVEKANIAGIAGDTAKAVWAEATIGGNTYAEAIDYLVNNTGLTAAQALQLTELYKTFGLDVTDPITDTATQRRTSSGDIIQLRSGDPDVSIVTARQP